jgi:hypothetical protein
VTCLCRQHTKHCDWEDFDGHEEFLDEFRMKGAKLGKKMVFEKKKIREKYLNEPPGWILGTIKRELNLLELCSNKTVGDLHDQHDTTLTYWRQNHREYPSVRVWDRFYFDLLCKSFESRHELQAWCVTRMKQLYDPMYIEEQHQQQMKDDEGKRLAWEAKEQRRCETPGIWEHYFTKEEETNIRARAAELGGTTSETWPPSRLPEGNFPHSLC